MASQTNSGFRQEDSLGSISRHDISSQSGAVKSTSEMSSLRSYFGGSMSTTATFLPENSVVNTVSADTSGLLQPGNSSVYPLLLELAPGLKHDTALATEWSAEEQYKLEEGLEKLNDEPSIMKYIKIAATLRGKTVRDVALRSRWMIRKRRKAEEHNTGTKISAGKDKQTELSSKVSTPSVLPQNMASYPLLMSRVGSHARIPCEGLSGNAIHLLEQNLQAFSQIRANLSMYKLQDNLNLFCQTRNNLVTILNDMRNMPGVVSQMPPLPVSINENLVNNILTDTPQSVMFGLPSSIRLKQEPRGL